jgi:F-type H+-transporting ATPase subunit b
VCQPDLAVWVLIGTGIALLGTLEPFSLACRGRSAVRSPNLSIQTAILPIMCPSRGSTALARLTVVHAEQTETQPGPPAPPAVEPGERRTGPAERPQLEETQGAEATEEAHEEGWFPAMARLVNAVILFGTLFYFLRAPVANYLSDRQKHVRRDLVTATDMRKDAAEQLEELDRKMRALPGEIEALKTQGAGEIAQEQARITRVAEAERQRLLEQTRREIDLQLRIAHRELIEHAADLAVGIAAERIKKHITDEDQARLVDRYVEQLKK